MKIQIWLKLDKNSGVSCEDSSTFGDKNESFVVKPAVFFVLQAVTDISQIHRERIVALVLQQWLSGHATLLRSTYGACLVQVVVKNVMKRGN